MQKLNAKQWPQVYSCKFLTAGLVSYEDSGAGIALLKKETIDRMLPSFIGKPIIIDHQDVNPDNFKAVAKGYVTAVRFSPGDGWFYADFIADDDDAVKCIEEEGYSVSCAYNVLDVAEGGTYQDIKYDGEITEGSFTHLALVKEPRYEESKITKESPMMLVNSKQAHLVKSNQEDKEMFKIFKKNAKEEKQEYTGMVVNIDGAEMPVDHLIKNYQDITAAEAEELKKKEEAKKNAKTVMNDKDIIDIAGHKVTIGEMVDKYKVFKENEKKNAPDDETLRKEQLAKEEADLKKANDKAAEDKAKAEAEAKENEKKNCTCGSEGADHKDGCTINKKNSKEEEELKNSKAAEDKAKAEAEALALENSKKEKQKGEEFFVELQNSADQVIGDEGGRKILPMTRSERAAAWKNRNSKQ